MAKEEQYRRLADECLTSANKVESPDTRGLLLRMAKAWLHLADEERAIGTDKFRLSKENGRASAARQKVRGYLIGDPVNPAT
jgi:hypothetical protein